MTAISCRVCAFSLLLCLFLSACGPWDKRFNPSKFTILGAGAPPDVVLPSDVHPGAVIFGIHTSEPNDSGVCCAADSIVEFPVQKDVTAAVLQIGLYVRKGSTQRLRVSFVPGKAKTSGTLKDGFSLVEFSVPASLRTYRGLVRVRVQAETAPYTLTSVYFR